MKKVIGEFGIGFPGATHREEFEFKDDVTEDEMYKIIYDWAMEYVEISWEEVEE